MKAVSVPVPVPVPVKVQVSLWPAVVGLLGPTVLVVPVARSDAYAQ
ncbi:MULTISPECIES: hypothetical protein [unclassified Streptomyces]|nr:hypothetical protein [Streptomyces sp. CB09001]